ncbi:MAG: hypothetical protein LBJ95_01610 [Oscillospiraceae bacterium]|jgi:hypothetical protein|nr:hypothetical protein [Oscillospiraceae bacterium]
MRLIKKLLPLLLSSSMMFSISPLKTLAAGANPYKPSELTSTDKSQLSRIRNKLRLLHSLLTDPNTFMNEDVRQKLVTEYIATLTNNPRLLVEFPLDFILTYSL